MRTTTFHDFRAWRIPRLSERVSTAPASCMNSCHVGGRSRCSSGMPPPRDSSANWRHRQTDKGREGKGMARGRSRQGHDMNDWERRRASLHLRGAREGNKQEGRSLPQLVCPHPLFERTDHTVHEATVLPRRLSVFFSPVGAPHACIHPSLGRSLLGVAVDHKP